MATVTRRGKSFSIRVSCGYDIAGKQIIKSMTWKPAPDMTDAQAEKEADRQAVLFEEKCRTGQVLQGTVRFADFAEIWLRDYAEKQLRATTLTNYKAHLSRRIIPALGHIRMDKLQPHHLIQFYNNLTEDGMKDVSTMRCVPDDLINHMKEQGFTRTECAKRASVAPVTLRTACQGKNISADCAARIADALGLPVGALFVAADISRSLDAATIRKIHAIISSILSTAVKWQVIFSNPCDRVQPPKVTRKHAVYLDERQAAHLLELLEKEDLQHRVMITLLLFSGLRRGELCGLEWSDIDFDNHLVHVRRSSLYLPEHGVFEDETKNFTSERVIKLPTSVLLLLRKYYTWQQSERLKIGDQWQDCNRLFTQWNGAPIHPDTISGWFSGFIAKTDLPPIHLHSLRHTNATLQIAGGVPITTVAQRLGHATPDTTAKVYAHAIKTANEAAAAILDDMLKPHQSKIK